MIRNGKRAAVALYLPSLRGGGAERVMVALANGFADRGINVDLVLAKAEGPFLSDVSPDVRIVDLDASRVLRSLPGLIRYLQREKPSVVLSALNHANVVATLAATIAGSKTRLILSEHNNIGRSFSGGGPKSVLLRKCMTYAYRRADMVVAVSNGVAADLIETLSFPPEKVRTIYNPIVGSKLQEQAKSEAPGFPSGVTVLAVGRLTQQKDYPTLLRAFAHVKDRTDATLIILGEGGLRLELEALAQDLGISERVHMPGFVANPYAWMAKTNLYVMSSAWEGLPTVLVEAMACGARVVSTDCPSGPAEILEDGKWGILVPVGDPAALGSAMLEALNSPAYADGMHRALQFSAGASVDAYINLMLND